MYISKRDRHDTDSIQSERQLFMLFLVNFVNI